MLKRPRYGGITWPRPAAARPNQPAGAKAYATKANTDTLVAKGPVAKQLASTGIWKRLGGRKKANAPTAHEPRRVNIVSQKLCDDIIKYIGPSLERHRGCDLIDLNPGSGLWSRSLHEFLEPRKHVMMDHDAELYQPFLRDLLAKDTVHMIPKAGVLWKDLLEMTNAQLGHQAEIAKGEAPRRNDTLLVTANLSTFPKKPFLGFESVSTMVLYQLVSSIRTSSLFQRYGLVRMLVWINDDDKRRMLPRSLQRRKRSAFVAELACDWLHEVAGTEAEEEARHNLRDSWLNTESGYNTVLRMIENNQAMPPHRATRMYREAMQPGARELLGTRLAGVRTPTVSRPFRQELEDLEHELADDDAAGAEPAAASPSSPPPLLSPEARRLSYLRGRGRQEDRMGQLYLELLRERDAAIALYDAGGSPAAAAAFAAADAAWSARLDNLNKNTRNEFLMLRDGLHLFRQDPPALLWDRRAYEPLPAAADEFYPNAPTALLDIQPRAMPPLLRQYGPGSGDAGALSDVMLRSWFGQVTLPVQRAMENISGGFGEMAAQCPSLTDPLRGGSPLTGRGALTARAINTGQWEEIVKAWMAWPFRPSYSRLLSLSEDEAEFEEEDGAKQSVMGPTF
ncbi:Mitochondrial transcription factor 1 [Escovopsis weberi]|uniref:Mitochondrial transcription factor 1 n=1 Tax=Escovopsis weberi TaxID=150374 RepID=A0A0M9VS51_ESCWE|nr:Mitochondrial transcription factor 1 [Escovopsis weberi]